MKQNILLEDNRQNERCGKASCDICQNCHAIRSEEKRSEWNSRSFQLYSKEAEHYFFYYDLIITQA
jgi:hypothetical protein